MAETGRIASVAFSEDDYYPSLSVYNPQISVDQMYPRARRRGYLCAACAKWKIFSMVL